MPICPSRTAEVKRGKKMKKGDGKLRIKGLRNWEGISVGQRCQGVDVLDSEARHVDVFVVFSFVIHDSRRSRLSSSYIHTTDTGSESQTRSGLSPCIV